VCEVTPSIDELSAQLKAAQFSVRQSERLVSVAHHAAESMHEASNPLEIIANVHYLIRHSHNDPELVLAYLKLAETQAARLLEIHTRVIELHRQAMKETDEASDRFVM
jgi:hypothetical protein